MFVIRDQQLRLLVLGQLIRELQQAAHDKTPPPEGFTPAQAEELAAISSAELVKLAEMTEPRVAVQIDVGSLEHGLRQVDYLNKRSRQLEYFITHGATSNMLSKLFRISSADVTLKRRLFSGTSSALRRPSMPPHAVRE
ncbi:MAG TPA: STY4526/YPO1902 family pathogenicity island replication protein, partial [Usitatibacter sp.]|nr:STY4526/YPO1902 family pathogenicity island replication protein [Usitatibacter sp.]